MKKYQVFISSIYENLITERAIAIKTILQLGHIPLTMEAFIATEKTQMNLIKKAIDFSDYFVLIIGENYGSMYDNEISYMEAEYNYALSQGKPIIALIKENFTLKFSAEDYSQQILLKKFKYRVQTSKNRSARWNNIDELAQNISLELNAEIETNPQIGWVKAFLVLNETDYNCGKIPKMPQSVPKHDTLLIGENNIPCLANNVAIFNLNKYKRVAYVSTSLFTLDISMEAASKNIPYNFDVIVGVECWVSNSSVYYLAKSLYNIEDDIYISLRRMVVQETINYEIIDEEISTTIFKKLNEKGNLTLDRLGITYSVISVFVKPNDDVQKKYLDEVSRIRILSKLEDSKINKKLNRCNLPSAILGLFVNGEIDFETALINMRENIRKESLNKLEDIENSIRFIRRLQNNKAINDEVANKLFSEFRNLFNSSNFSTLNTGEVHKLTIINIEKMLGDILQEQSSV